MNNKQQKIAGYHGLDEKPPYFEGWYFKIVDRQARRPMAFIPGIYLAEQPLETHAFLQILDGANCRSHYIRYDANDMDAQNRGLRIRIGDCTFSQSGCTILGLPNTAAVHGDLRFGPLHPWPCTWTSPGIMGWYSYVPAMECYHGVLSLDHSLEGHLIIDGEKIDYSGGRGYIEKDWGSRFPEAYVWLQCNHFDQPGISVVASLAIIPWLRSAFRGFIAGFLCDGKLHRFATYTGARSEQLEFCDERLIWQVNDLKFRLILQAQRRSGAGLLRGPGNTGMGRKVAESLQSLIQIAFYERDNLVYAGSGHSAGLELSGDLDRLRGMKE